MLLIVLNSRKAFGDSVEFHVCGNNLQSLDNVFHNAVHVINQCLIYRTVSLISVTHVSRNQRGEMGILSWEY